MNVETDVLVVGGGVAACMAAVEAAKYGVRVAVVDKGMAGRSGSSVTADAAISAALGHTSLEAQTLRDGEELHFRDTLEKGEGMNDCRLVAHMCREIMPLLSELEHMGVAFSKTPDGRFYQYRTLGHTCARSCGPVGGGRACLGAMRREALHRGVRLVENVMLTRLLVDGGRAVGAYGLGTEDGEACTFSFHSAVLAAGSATGLFKYASANFLTSGDAFVLAHDAGARLANLEFVEFTIVPKVGRKVISSSGLSPFAGRGSRFYNAAGERIMERYDPERLERATRAVVARAVYQEMAAGRGPVLNDSSHFPSEVWDEFERNQEAVLHKLRAAGLDHRTQPFAWVPAVHTLLGGVVIEPDGSTDVEALFAAGESTTGVHGSTRLSDNAYSECLVFGKRAGRSAARFAHRAQRSQPGRARPELPRQAVDAERERVAGMLRPRGESRAVVERLLRDAAWEGIGLVRQGPALAAAAERFRDLATVPVRVAQRPHLARAIELQNLCRVGGWIARAALQREESRGQHHRADFPRIEADWRRWITLQRDAWGIQPVPETRAFAEAIAR